MGIRQMLNRTRPYFVQIHQFQKTVYFKFILIESYNIAVCAPEGFYGNFQSFPFEVPWTPHKNNDQTLPANDRFS